MAFVPIAPSGCGCSQTTLQSTRCELFSVSRRQRLAVAACAKPTNSMPTSSGTSRRRGRPRKNLAVQESHRASGGPENRAETIADRKRRGRPRKKAATGDAVQALGSMDEYVAKQALKREEATPVKPVVASTRSVSGRASTRKKSAITAPVVDAPDSTEQSVERPAPPPLTQAEKLVLQDTPFADRRYGACVICGDPVAIPGLERFFCGRCGWVRRPVETKTIAPGHHD